MPEEKKIQILQQDISTEELFEAGEITDIVKIATKFAGFGVVEEIEDLKN